MPTVMIIGASRGIGLELARQYAAAGWRVQVLSQSLRPIPYIEMLKREKYH